MISFDEKAHFHWNLRDNSLNIYFSMTSFLSWFIRYIMRINKSRRKRTPEIFSHAARECIKCIMQQHQQLAPEIFLKSDIFSASCVFRMKRKERKKEWENKKLKIFNMCRNLNFIIYGSIYFTIEGTILDFQ